MSHLIPSKTLLRRVLATTICAVLLALSFGRPTTGVEAADESTDGPRLFTKCWEYGVTPDLAKPAVSDSNGIYFLTGNSELQAVDWKTGAKLWSTELGGDVVSNLLLTDSGVIVATTSQETSTARTARTVLRSVSKQTGITVWVADLPASASGSLGTLNGNVVFVGSDGRVIAVGSDGKGKWDLTSGAAVTTQPSFEHAAVLFGNQNKEIVRVSTAGTLSIVSKIEFTASALLSGSADRLIVGDERGNVVSVSDDGSTQWKFKNGARISSILPYESEYIATSFDNFVYKLSRGGNVEWKRRLTGRVSGWPLRVGDSMVVSVVGLGSVYVLDLKNGKISDRFETDEETSAGIALASPDSFTISSSRGLSLYSRAGCANKKGDAVPTSPGKKS